MIDRRTTLLLGLNFLTALSAGPLFGVAAEDTVTISVQRGWNIVSLPLLVEDSHVSALFPSALFPSALFPSALFPSAVSPAFGYDGGYIEAESLFTGSAYRLKFD